MTVYVVQQPKPDKLGWSPDLSSAAEYGKIEFVFDAGEQVAAFPAGALYKARKALKDFNPEKDYLVWAQGDPAAMIAVNIALMEHGPTQIKYLAWNRKRNVDGARDNRAGFYVPCTFEMSQTKEHRHAGT